MRSSRVVASRLFRDTVPYVIIMLERLAHALPVQLANSSDHPSNLGSEREGETRCQIMHGGSTYF